MLKKLLLYSISILLILVTFICSFWINLDSKAIIPWLENRINAQIPRQYSISIDSTENYLLGSKINQVTLKDVASNESLFVIDSIDLKMNLISLALFQELEYSVNLYEGSVSGKIDLFPQIKTTFKILNVQINRNTYIRKTNLILSNPIIEGEGNYEYSEATGDLTLNCTSLTLTGDQNITNLPVTLPTTTLERIRSGWNFKKNQTDVQIDSSGDITANLKGEIDLNLKRAERSKLDLIINARLTEKYETNLGFLKSFLVNYKDNTGQVSVKISGGFQRPNIKKF